MIGALVESSKSTTDTDESSSRILYVTPSTINAANFNVTVLDCSVFPFASETTQYSYIPS